MNENESEKEESLFYTKALKAIFLPRILPLSLFLYPFLRLIFSVSISDVVRAKESVFTNKKWKKMKRRKKEAKDWFL